jgi:hypothetical protein
MNFPTGSEKLAKYLEFKNILRFIMQTMLTCSVLKRFSVVFSTKGSL